MKNCARHLFVYLCLAPVSVYAGDGVEFYRDVMPLVADNCITCHSEAGVSFSFENPEETYNLRMAIASAVADERMPPWLAESGHQAYVGDYSLTAEEKQLVAEWAGAGFPKGEPTASRFASPDVMEFDADLTVSVIPDGSYLPNQERKDDYRCFVFDWPYEEDMYVTGFMATPGNQRVSHHLVNFVVGPEAAPILKTLSEEEPGQGHQCFGGALPDSIGSKEVQARLEERFPGGLETLYKNNFWLSHWAPGMYGEEFPADTGILVRPGSVIVVQMHYYSAFAPGEPDVGTEMHFKLAKQVDKPSVNLPLTNNRWLYGARNQTMTIPPGESASYEVSETFEQVAGFASHALRIPPEEIGALELRSANIHMHSFGASGEASLLHASGQKETLLSIPRWDLDWQRDFLFEDSKIIPKEEFGRARLIVECTFENYTEEVVYGGYGSDDEMCFNFSYVSVIRQEESVASTE
ncbi:MAG: hypothetical protein V2I25_06205 [Woeseiaceae bacterium]|nr:hypothetical protein [Woeseiaceae bacterium]